MKGFIKIIVLIVCFLLLTGFSQISSKSLFGIRETMTLDWSTGASLYSGYYSAGWKDNSMGILTGNHFFPTYYQIASWQ